MCVCVKEWGPTHWWSPDQKGVYMCAWLWSWTERALGQSCGGLGGSWDLWGHRCTAGAEGQQVMGWFQILNWFISYHYLDKQNHSTAHHFFMWTQIFDHTQLNMQSLNYRKTLCTRVHTHTTYMTWHTSRTFVCLNEQPTPAVVWLVAALQQQCYNSLE